jgi:hypothetical protein
MSKVVTSKGNIIKGKMGHKQETKAWIYGTGVGWKVGSCTRQGGRGIQHGSIGLSTGKIHAHSHARVRVRVDACVRACVCVSQCPDWVSWLGFVFWVSVWMGATAAIPSVRPACRGRWRLLACAPCVRWLQSWPPVAAQAVPIGGRAGQARAGCSCTSGNSPACRWVPLVGVFLSSAASPDASSRSMHGGLH